MRVLYLFLMLLILCGQSVWAQNSNRQERKMQNKMALATEKYQQGEKKEALDIYKFVRENGNYGQSALTANDSIAWMSYDTYDLDEMYSSILYYEKYLSANPYDDAITNEYNFLKDSYFTLKDSLTIAGDICGVWISDYCEDDEKAPYFALEIVETDTGFVASIHPNCQVAKMYPTYRSKKYKYKPSSELPIAKMDFYVERDSIHINFADKKFRKGCPELAKAGGDLGIEMLKLADNWYNEVTSDPYFFSMPTNFRLDVYGLTIGIMAAAAAIGVIAILIANSKTYAYSIDLQLVYERQGLMKCVITENSLGTRLSGGKEHKFKTMEMNLIKLYPDYEIRFIGYNNQLLGSHRYTKQEAKNYPEYKYKKGMILTHNTDSYERLIHNCLLFHNNNSDKEIIDPAKLSDEFTEKNSGKNQTVIPTSYGYYIGKTQNGKPLVTPAQHRFKKDNCVFWGTVSDGKRFGEGVEYKYYYNSQDSTTMLGSITRGTWNYGELNGYAEHHNVIKHTLYKGNFRNGYIADHGILIDSVKGVQYEGNWYPKLFGMSYLFGNGEERTLDGRIIYFGEYKWGDRHGFGVEIDCLGNKYEGRWKQGKKHGKGISTVTSGKIDTLGVYQEKWKRGKIIKRDRYEK